MAEVNDTISVRREGEIGLVISNNPPVNALSHAVREGLVAAVAQLNADAEVKAIVIACEGRTFFAGADITEFGKTKREPFLQDAINIIEASPKPVVAAIHGTALGGGFEVALGCHFRVAVPSAKMGLPEINLGIFPGAGGTQRLPRIIGPEKALEFVLSGDPVSAGAALELGILDAVVDDDPVRAGAAFARKVLAENRSTIPVRARDDKLADARKDPSSFDALAAALTKRAGRQLAPAANVASVRRSFAMPFDEAMAADARAIGELMAGSQSKALRYQFFAEREAAKIPGVADGARPREIKTVAVVGAGTMGGGIAMSFASAGVPVALIDVSEEAVGKGIERIRGVYAGSVKRGSITQEKMDANMALISGAASREAAAGADIVVEAVFEDMALKAEIFSELGRLTRPGAVLASNTSALNVDEIAEASGRPEDFVGMHFFAPANVMKLLEVVRAAKSSPASIATAMAAGRRIGKISVLSGNCDGFIGNRMVAKRSAAAERLLQQGAMPRNIDDAFKAFGFPMGPLEINDMSGLDVGWSIRKRRGTPFPIADAICERGWFGQKTGQGYYRYEKGSRAPSPNPDVEKLILETSARLGIKRRAIGEAEIIERLLYPLVNEGARIVEEGIALRPSDVDVVYVNGYGWPRWRGGPLWWADEVGLKTIVERLDAFRADTDDPSLEPAALLRRLAAEGRSFADLRTTDA